METNYKYSVNDRMNAIIRATYPELDVKKERYGMYLDVPITIEDHTVLKLDSIKIDEKDHLEFGNQRYVTKPDLNENGEPIIYDGYSEKGEPQSSNCTVKGELHSIDQMIADYITEKIERETLVIPLDITPIIETVIAWQEIIEKASPAVEEAEKKRKRDYDVWKENKRIEQEQRREEENRQKHEHYKQKQREDQILETTRKTWIDNHGSEMLKEATKREYPCVKRFLKEWGAHTLGEEYVLDYNHDVTVQERACPSDEALKIIMDIQNKMGIKAEIVWLPKGLDELYETSDPYDYDYDRPVPREAVCITLEKGIFYRIGYNFYKLI